MYTQIKDLKIHYRIFGSGPKLLFIHGWGVNYKHYSKLLDHLRESFEIIALDLPGCGLSGTLNEVWDSENYVDFILQFAQKLHLVDDPIIVVGHSLGGKVGALLAARKLLNIEKLVLIGASGIKSKITFKKRCISLVCKIAKKIAYLPLIKSFAGKYVEIYQKRIGSTDAKNATGVMRDTLLRLVREDFRNEFPKIAVSTLLLWGAQDQHTPLSGAKVMASLIPNVTLEVIEGTDHYPYLNKLDQMIIILDNYLKT